MALPKTLIELPARNALRKDMLLPSDVKSKIEIDDPIRANILSDTDDPRDIASIILTLPENVEVFAMLMPLPIFTAALIDMEDPQVIKSNIESLPPRRVYPRALNAEPKVTKSRTLRLPPIFPRERREKVEPNEAKPRTLTSQPPFIV
jgi:hypothetical protein